MALSEEYKTRLRAFEGRIPYMYRDDSSDGYVTVGYGHALFTKVDAMNLPVPMRILRNPPGGALGVGGAQALMIGAQQMLSALGGSPPAAPPVFGFWQPGGEIATRDEIGADWDRVHAAPKFTNKTHYREYTRCWLEDQAIEQLFAMDVASRWAGLLQLHPDLESFPPSAQDALFDIYYNSDYAKSGKWPNLKAAVAARDWSTAAAESERGQVGDDRNHYTRQCFIDAASDENLRMYAGYGTDESLRPRDPLSRRNLQR